jgi:transcription-repair coupling factor (superfamily II helicase)
VSAPSGSSPTTRSSAAPAASAAAGGSGAAAPSRALSQLQPGEYVVHLDHGIGRFRGLERVTVSGTTIESLAIEYAGGEVLRLPVYRLDLVERWVPDRDEAEPPSLHKIGGKTWKRIKQRTQEAIERMAAELLELYASRELAERPPYPEDTPLAEGDGERVPVRGHPRPARRDRRR